VIIAGITSGVCNTLIIALIGAGLSQAAASPLTMARAFVGLCLLLAVTRFASQALLARLAQGTILDIRMRLARRVLSAPLRQMEEIGAPRILAALTDDVRTISDALVTIPILCIMGAVLISCLAYLAWLSLLVFLLVLGFMAVGILTYQLLVGRGTRFFRQARESQDELFDGLRTLTSGAKELKLHRGRREAFLSDVLQPAAGAFRRNNVSGLTMYAVANSWGQILLFALVWFILFVLFQFGYVDLHVLTGYVLVLLYMVTPLDAVLNSIPPLIRANIALKKVESLGLSLEAEDAPRAGEVPPVWESLELRGVMHAYYRERENGNFILGPINLSLRPGELVFLIGGNGSGKTTLAKILTGLYTPEAGEIRFNGLLISDQNRDLYRQHFSAVFSDFHLFERFLGVETWALDDRVQEYLTRLQLSHKVQVRDGRLSTTELSQGQRKRLALLTAYLEDRQIYVFDEWAADQDPLFKEIFYLQLLPELKARKKAVLVITHDDQYYSLADRVVRLNYGKLEYDEQVSESLSRPCPATLTGEVTACP
jgi:putative pyoverdin transport system ATP-binding/permease protein